MPDPLAKIQVPDPLTPAQARDKNHRVYAALWHKRNVVAIDPATITNDWDRQHLINMAEKLYGRRKDG